MRGLRALGYAVLGAASPFLVSCGGHDVDLQALPACFEVSASAWDPPRDELSRPNGLELVDEPSRPKGLELTDEPFTFELYGPDPLGSLATLFFENGNSTQLAWKLSPGRDSLTATFGVFTHYTLAVIPSAGGSLAGELRWEDDAGSHASAAVELRPADCRAIRP